jgi:hypothetical protein
MTSCHLPYSLHPLVFLSYSLIDHANYIYSKPPSAINQGWFYWTTPDFQKINPDLDQVAALIFITRKKEIGIIYKPTPVLDAEKKKLLRIIGNMLEEGSTPAIIKIDGGEIESCFTIQVFEDIPQNYRPEIALQPEMLKDTEWDGATKSLALIMLPTLAPLPFGKEIKSTMLDDDFVDKKEKNLSQARVLGKNDGQRLRPRGFRPRHPPHCHQSK